MILESIKNKSLLLSEHYQSALFLLQQLISTPSFSKDENITADILVSFFENKVKKVFRKKNNIWIFNEFYDENKPTILLNSHHDTVKPNPGYTKNPFEAEIKDGKLYGLGSNDAGGCLVSLIHVFLHFYTMPDLKYNFCFAASAEEEISGKDGLELIYPELGKIDFAIVGEPTDMDIAVAEKGLMVVDFISKGKSGHAAREEGINAIYIALKDIDWIRNYKFEKVSPFLGPVKMTTTIIQAGTQHNVVPEFCSFTVDVRMNECYTNEDIIKTFTDNLESVPTPRSIRLKPSFIDVNHVLVTTAQKYGAKTYGSPTTSDQALIPVPSVKMGPGHSGRSHTADEYIFVDEIKKGIEKYILILEEVVN